MIHDPNLPDDWGAYYVTCSRGHSYHMSDGGCGHCMEEAETEEERVWDELLARMKAPGFVVTDAVLMVAERRDFYSELFTRICVGEHFICVVTEEPDGTDEIDLTLLEWHNVTRALRLAYVAREDWE